jgi:ATP-binding cassette, subfamily B, bacterial
MGEMAEASSAPNPVTVDDILTPAGSEQRALHRLPSLIAEALRLVWKAAPKQFVVAAALQLLAGLSLAGQLLVMRSLLDRLGGAGALPNLATIAPQLLAFGALLLVVMVAALAQQEQQQLLGEYVHKYTVGQVFEVATGADLIDFDRPAFYDRLQRATLNAAIRPVQITNGLIGLIASGSAVVAVGITLFLLEPTVSFLLLAGVGPAMYLNRLSSRAMHAHAVRMTANDRQRGYLHGLLTRKDEAHEIRAFATGRFFRARHDLLYDEKVADLRRTLRKRLWYGLMNAGLVAVVTIGALVLLVVFVDAGRLTTADAAIAVGAVLIVAGKVRGLTGSTGSLYEGALFLRDFTDFVAASRRSSEVTATDRDALNPRLSFEVIELDGVGFTYPSREQASLQGISLTIRHGEVIALVGENGSGKTTLTKLLAGLYRPTVGTVRWDGIDVSSGDLAPVRDQVTVIFQDFARYFLPARENVAVSRIEQVGDDAAIREAAVRAGADGFISQLPGGYSALLGPSFFGGSDLSLGQWQRVALARAYFRDAPMLILDEPTASLDPRGEYEIFQQVRRLAAGHTVILVSHRFSSVRAADRILVLDGGRIVEEGSHDELLAQGGLYAELFELQAQGYRGVSG